MLRTETIRLSPAETAKYIRVCKTVSSSSFRYTVVMFYIYVLQHSVNQDLYIGYTDNIKRRLEEHNRNENKSTTRRVGVWGLVYCEVYSSQTDAQQREKKLKQHGSGKRELYKRIKNSLLPKTGAGSVA